MTLSTSMPISEAISLSSATARMDFPLFVLATNRVSAIIPTTAATMVMAAVRCMGMPRIFHRPSITWMSG